MAACLMSGEGSHDAEKVTYSELRTLVQRYAAALRQAGVEIGDRVAGEGWEAIK